MNADYFRRIEALNFTMDHDDGQLPGDYEEADVILVGISRTSKTPTSIYLANRGIRTANVPIVRDVPLPRELLSAEKPLVVGLVATAEPHCPGSSAPGARIDRRLLRRAVTPTGR